MPSSSPAQTRVPQADRSRAMRARLLEATVELLVERGFAGTSTTLVSERAGVSRGAQLHHFPTKNDLVVAAVEHLTERRGAELAEAFDRLSAEPVATATGRRTRLRQVLEMLGGTLTATFLALSDARPDLATLSAVGAAPRTRRRVAASYALVIGSVGALLGAGVGFIPGIAISRPLTSGFGSSGPGPDGPFLAIPWLLIVVIVVALPLLTAAVVGLSARSRLPLVARLD